MDGVPCQPATVHSRIQHCTQPRSVGEIATMAGMMHYEMKPKENLVGRLRILEATYSGASIVYLTPPKEVRSSRSFDRSEFY
jgi:hypothetical protein